MALDLTTALNKFGFVGTLANAIPELRDIFAQAAAQEWPVEQFNRAVQDTGWYRTSADSARQLLTLQVTDPATFNQNWTNATTKVHLLAQQMGRNGVDPGTLQSLAMQALTGNWDDEQLKAIIGERLPLATGEAGSLTGDAAQLETHMRALASGYGVPITPAFLTGQLTAIQGGHNTLDGFESLMRARAKATYPQFADQIDLGMTVRDVADPWIASMAKTLEVPETQLSLDTPEVQKALQQRNPDGTVTAQPLWQFTRALKDDPRYDKTTQARTDANSMMLQIGRDFGFAS